jgi:lipoprotein
MLNKVKKLICALLCIVTLVGCGIAKKNPQYVAELRFPYVGPTNHKKLEVSYRFQNTDVRVGQFPSISHLILKVYNEDGEMLGYEIVDAYDKYRFLKEDDYDMIFGVTTINLDTEVKQGDKLRVVGKAEAHYRDDESKDVTLTDEVECVVD